MIDEQEPQRALLAWLHNNRHNLTAVLLDFIHAYMDIQEKNSSTTCSVLNNIITDIIRANNNHYPHTSITDNISFHFI